MDISSIILDRAEQSLAVKAETDLDKRLGREDFLQLLVTQLRYQDPTKPMSNEDFIAQTAQFSALEQMQILNASVESLVDLQKASIRSSSFDLIGKQVIAEGSDFMLSDKSPVRLAYSLSESADVVITIADAGGKTVRTINLGNQSAGDHNFVWNGVDDNNVNMENGRYAFNVSAKDADGTSVRVTKSVSGIANGLSFKDDQTYVSVNGFPIPLSAITAVLERN